MISLIQDSSWRPLRLNAGPVAAVLILALIALLLLVRHTKGAAGAQHIME